MLDFYLAMLDAQKNMNVMALESFRSWGKVLEGNVGRNTDNVIRGRLGVKK